MQSQPGYKVYALMFLVPMVKSYLVAHPVYSEPMAYTHEMLRRPASQCIPGLYEFRARLNAREAENEPLAFVASGIQQNPPHYSYHLPREKILRRRRRRINRDFLFSTESITWQGMMVEMFMAYITAVPNPQFAGKGKPPFDRLYPCVAYQYGNTSFSLRTQFFTSQVCCFGCQLPRQQRLWQRIP
jgi:hypothetical protein